MHVFIKFKKMRRPIRIYYHGKPKENVSKSKNIEKTNILE